MSTNLRINITAALAACADGDLTAACLHLLDVLGYRSAKRFVLAPNSAQNFAATFGVDRPLPAAQARTDEWSEANLLFQLTDSEVAQTEQMHLLREDGGWNRGIYRSFLFLAIGLTGERYSRTALATITRAVNRLFMMPTPCVALPKIGISVTDSLITMPDLLVIIKSFKGFDESEIK